jgi:hypothetical protein
MAYAAVHPQNPFHVLSESIPSNENGHYQFPERIFLTFIEPLRRDMIRATRAVENFSPLECPWQARYLHIWISEYFVPYILLFQESVDLYIVPHYTRLGVDFPLSIRDRDTYIYSQCDLLKILAKDINLLMQSRGEDLTEVPVKVDQLKIALPALLERLRIWHSEVESFCVPIYGIWEEDEYQKLESRISTHFLTKRRYTSSIVTAAIYHGWGYDFRGYERPTIQCPVEDSPWCSERTRIEAMQKFSYLFTEYLVSSWNERYQRYKIMIDSIYLGEDRLQASTLTCTCIIT